jgi:hypothetical protein
MNNDTTTLEAPATPAPTRKKRPTTKRTVSERQKKLRAALKRDHLPRLPIGRFLIARMKRLNMNRAETALASNEAASQISRLATGFFDEFSADRMIGYANALGCDVELTIIPREVQVNRRNRTCRVWPKGHTRVRVEKEVPRV